MKLSRHKMVRSTLAILAAAGMVFAVSTPAQAAGDIAIVKVGNQSSVTGYTVFTRNDGSKGSIYVTSYWTQFATNSAKLTSFKVCSGTLPYPVLLRTITSKNGATIKDYGLIGLNSNSCISYTVNSVMTATPNNELVRVWAKFIEYDGSLIWQTVSFTR